MFDSNNNNNNNNNRARNEDFYQMGFGNQTNARGKIAEGSSNLTGKGGGDSLDTISKSDIIGISLNSCIRQDEEVSDLSHFLRGEHSADYEYRPESFEVKALNSYFPKKIKQAILSNLKSIKLDLKDFSDRKSLLAKLSSEPSALKSKTLVHHSIFYIYSENEIIFWNWSKNDPIYSVQTEEFFQENTQKKAVITSVGSFEDENSPTIKILVSTNYYILLLCIVKNANGNYIINRVKDSFLSLSGLKGVSFSHIISHQASGRFFLGCGNTGTVYEYTMEQESSWIKRKVKKISGLVNTGDSCQSDGYDESLARLINISGSRFVSYLPRFIRNYFFGKPQSVIRSMSVDEYRGLLYVLYTNSDIDVFLIPIGSFLIKKVSDDLTYIEKGGASHPPGSMTMMSSYVGKYLTLQGSSLNSFSPSALLFRINANTIKSELNRLIGTSQGKRLSSLPSTQQKRGLCGISSLSIHSVHPTNPQESDLIYAILVTKSGDRIYLESVFESGSKLQFKDQYSQSLTFSTPASMRVKEFKRTRLSSDDSEELLVNSSTYSNGVFITTTVSLGDGLLDLSESRFGEVPESLQNDKEESIFPLITSNISASCIDQVMVAKALSNRKGVGSFSSTQSSGAAPSSPPHLGEWQYSFSDPNLGLVLSIQERNVPAKYQRLFENLWNTPNPFSRDGSSREEMVFIRPNIHASNHDKLLSSSNNGSSGFGCKTSGSKFFHLWRYFFNRLSSKSVQHANGTREGSSNKPHCLIQKYLKSPVSSSVFGISFPQCPPNGLNDLILDQITECRSWTIVTTKGIFVLEKKRLLDIITRMTLEPHNYSFMMNIFDNQESFSPISGLNSSFRGRLAKDNKFQNCASVTFIMKLLGTFAQTITFEQFFALIWQGLVVMSTKGVIDSDLIQKFYSSEMKNDSPFEIHIRNMTDVGMFEKKLPQNFPSITLIKIWLTLLSDANIQSRSNSSCLLSISSFNHKLAVTPRFKGLLLLIGRIIRSIWAIPLFQQTSFEVINKNSLDLYRYLDEEKLNENPLFGQSSATINEFDSQDHHPLMDNSESKFVSEFIKSQIERLERFCQDDVLLPLNDSSLPKSSSCRNKDVVLDIKSCIHDFFKYEASNWFSHNQVDVSGPCERTSTSKASSGLIPENNTSDFATNDSVSMTIVSSLTEDHISHLKNNLVPINSLLDLLLPWWFPNYSVEVSRNDDENEVILTNYYSSSSSAAASSGLGSSNSVQSPNIYSLINISELQLFIEIKNFVCKTIEILEMMSLFCKTYPLGLRYNAKITDEAILCSSYMDVLKKSITEFTLFELSSNKGLQFVLRLLFRYNILSASQFMSSLNPKSKPFLIPSQLIAVEHCISSLNKDLTLGKRKRSYQEVLSSQKNRPRVLSKTKTNTSEHINQQHQLGSPSHSQIMYMLFENLYEVPLNVVLSLLYHKRETSSIITLISSQSEYIHHTGLLPPWLSNGERVEVYTPTSISEFSSHISESNLFVKYFLSILLFEINQCEPQYSNRLMSFQDILVSFEQSGCKTLLEFCKTSSLTHAVRSIYTYEFHCCLWIYQNLQHTLDIIYNEYIIEIEKFLSKIHLIDDPAFDYLRELEVSLNNLLKNSTTPSEKKLLEDRLCMFKTLRESILKTKSSIIEFILCCLKQQESDLHLKFNKPNQKLFLSTCKEWLHYYLFSYVSYIDSCMQKTVHEEITSRKGGNRLENWLIKNLCISVFQFSEYSVYLKNWLEHFHLSEEHSYCLSGGRNRGGIRSEGVAGGLGRTEAGFLVGQEGSGGVLRKRSEHDSMGGVSLVSNNYNNENNLRNDQGYLLYNAKQYLSAGQHYYSKSKVVWKIPSGVNAMIARAQGEIFRSTSRGGSGSSAKMNGGGGREVAKMQELMKKSLESYKRRVSSSSSIQGGKRLDAIFDLLSDIHVQVLKMQQDPTLIQRRSLLLQSQTCIERDMNDDKNKELIKSIRCEIFNIDAQIEILLQIAEFINYYILSALEQNVNITPLVKQIFGLFDTDMGADGEALHLNENFEISQEGIDIFKSLIMGIFHIQSMVHTNETLMEFITEFYNLTGFSSITEIEWLIENSKGDPRIINHIIAKIPSLCEYRTKQAFFYESPILFEMNMAELLRLCDNSIPYDLLSQSSKNLKSGLNSRIISLQQFDSILETLALELYKFSILYYNRFRQNDLVDIYSFEDITQVKSRVLWWVWPVRFILFHLNNKFIVSRLLALFSGNSNNSSVLSGMISSHERMEISEIIKASVV